MTVDHVLGFIVGWSCAVLAATAYLVWIDRKDES